MGEILKELKKRHKDKYVTVDLTVGYHSFSERNFHSMGVYVQGLGWFSGKTWAEVLKELEVAEASRKEVHAS